MKFRSASIVVMLAIIWVATPSMVRASGLLVGLNSANVTFDPDPDFKAERRTGFVAGLSFNVPVQDMFSVELDALFAQKGTKLSFEGETQKVNLNIWTFPCWAESTWIGLNALLDISHNRRRFRGSPRDRRLPL